VKKINTVLLEETVSMPREKNKGGKEGDSYSETKKLRAQRPSEWGL